MKVIAPGENKLAGGSRLQAPSVPHLPADQPLAQLSCDVAFIVCDKW